MESQQPLIFVEPSPAENMIKNWETNFNTQNHCFSQDLRHLSLPFVFVFTFKHEHIPTAKATVPHRSNPTGNVLLERKWNAKWKATGTPKECQNFCGAGARSEQECENAFH